jgi:hypothetical protein
MRETHDILERLLRGRQRRQRRRHGPLRHSPGQSLRRRYARDPFHRQGTGTRTPNWPSALWSTNVLEARMLAAMIADPLQITEEEVERWVREFDCWPVCDSACIGLLWKTPFAWRKVREWSRREPEYERRAAFALLAGLAVHDKKAADKQFRAGLRLIVEGSRRRSQFREKGCELGFAPDGQAKSGIARGGHRGCGVADRCRSHARRAGSATMHLRELRAITPCPVVR